MFHSLQIQVNNKLGDICHDIHTPDLLFSKQPLTVTDFEHKYFTFKMSTDLTDSSDECDIDTILEVLAHNESSGAQQSSSAMTPEEVIRIQQLERQLRSAHHFNPSTTDPNAPHPSTSMDPHMDVNQLLVEKDIRLFNGPDSQVPTHTAHTPYVNPTPNTDSMAMLPVMSPTPSDTWLLRTEFGEMVLNSPGQPFSPDSDMSAVGSPSHPRNRGNSSSESNTGLGVFSEPESPARRVRQQQRPYERSQTYPFASPDSTGQSLLPFGQAFPSQRPHSSSVSQVYDTTAQSGAGAYRRFQSQYEPQLRGRSISEPQQVSGLLTAAPASNRGRPCKRGPGARGPKRAADKRREEQEAIDEQVFVNRDLNQRMHDLQSEINYLLQRAAERGLYYRRVNPSHTDPNDPNAPVFERVDPPQQPVLYNPNVSQSVLTHNTRAMAPPTATAPNPNYASAGQMGSAFPSQQPVYSYPQNPSTSMAAAQGAQQSGHSYGSVGQPNQQFHTTAHTPQQVLQPQLHVSQSHPFSADPRVPATDAHPYHTNTQYAGQPPYHPNQWPDMSGQQ